MRFEPLRYEHLRQMAEIEKEAFDMPWTESMFIPEVNSENATYIVGTRGEEVVVLRRLSHGAGRGAHHQHRGEELGQGQRHRTLSACHSHRQGARKGRALQSSAA